MKQLFIKEDNLNVIQAILEFSIESHISENSRTLIGYLGEAFSVFRDS